MVLVFVDELYESLEAISLRIGKDDKVRSSVLNQVTDVTLTPYAKLVGFYAIVFNNSVKVFTTTSHLIFSLKVIELTAGRVLIF